MYLIKYVTMLFTVNVEMIRQPYMSPLRQIQPGYGIKTSPFSLTQGKIHYSNSLPIESETGLEVIPGKQELETVLELFPKCVGVVCKESKILGYKYFSWPGHVYANRPVYAQFTVDKVTQRLGCVDVNWLCELKDSADKTACKLIIKQRNYTQS